MQVAPGRKRSECSITITVASGTSTPTSTTVVAIEEIDAGARELLDGAVGLISFRLAMHQPDALAKALPQLPGSDRSRL